MSGDDQRTDFAGVSFSRPASLLFGFFFAARGALIVSAAIVSKIACRLISLLDDGGAFLDGKNLARGKKLPTPQVEGEFGAEGRGVISAATRGNSAHQTLRRFSEIRKWGV